MFQGVLIQYQKRKVQHSPTPSFYRWRKRRPRKSPRKSHSFSPPDMVQQKTHARHQAKYFTHIITVNAHNGPMRQINNLISRIQMERLRHRMVKYPAGGTAKQVVELAFEPMQF